MAGRRRRFGVSLPEEYAALLDAVAEALGVTRSEVVERALRGFLEEHRHYTVEHTCTGLLVVTGSDRSDISGLLEEYRDIIIYSAHHHVGGRCVEIVLVHGDSRRVVELEKRLSSAGCPARFIPIHASPTAGGE